MFSAETLDPSVLGVCEGVRERERGVVFNLRTDGEGTQTEAYAINPSPNSAI